MFIIIFEQNPSPALREAIAQEGGKVLFVSTERTPPAPGRTILPESPRSFQGPRTGALKARALLSRPSVPLIVRSPGKKLLFFTSKDEEQAAIAWGTNRDMRMGTISYQTIEDILSQSGKKPGVMSVLEALTLIMPHIENQTLVSISEACEALGIEYAELRHELGMR